MAVVFRWLAVPAWVGVIALLTTWSEGDPALVGAVIATVALGVAIGRWWALLVPAAPALYLIGALLLSSDDDYYETSPELWAAFVGAAGVVAVVLVALGVLLHRLVASAARPSGARARSHG